LPYWDAYRPPRNKPPSTSTATSGSTYITFCTSKPSRNRPSHAIPRIGNVRWTFIAKTSRHELLSRDNLQGWWPQHNRANLAWIAAATPLVAKYETAMKKELSAAYQTPWPPDPIRTNVAEYASWTGAYTALDPTHITVSSSGTVTQAAVETLFHEASQRSCFSGAPSGTRCSFLHSRRSCAAESG
jgi:hypothetical protein